MCSLFHEPSVLTQGLMSLKLLNLFQQLHQHLTIAHMCLSILEAFKESAFTDFKLFSKDLHMCFFFNCDKACSGILQTLSY